MFLWSYRNTTESLGEQEMVWEHEPHASVSTAFLSSPTLSRLFVFKKYKICTCTIFLSSYRNTSDSLGE